MNKAITLAALVLTSSSFAASATDFPFSEITRNFIGESKEYSSESRDMYGYSSKLETSCALFEYFSIQDNNYSYIVTNGSELSLTASSISDSVLIATTDSTDPILPQDHGIPHECLESSSFLSKSLYDDGTTSYYQYHWPTKVVIEIYYEIDENGEKKLNNPTGVSIKAIGNGKVIETFHTISQSFDPIEGTKHTLYLM